MWVAIRSWKRQRNRFSSRAFRTEHTTVDTLILALLNMYWTSNLQNCKMINLYCFKPLNLR